MQIGLNIKQAVITGANGFIGRWLTTLLTEEGVTVYAFMRQADRKIGELRGWVDQHNGRGELIIPCEFDLLADGLNLTAEGTAALQRADAVYHLAAMFQFGLDQETAHRANVTAATDLIALSAANKRLRRFIHISGYRTMSPAAQALDVSDQGAVDRYYRAHGAYEASKMVAHGVVQQSALAHGVPLTVVSPAVVIGDSRTGETTQLLGIADTVKQLWAGKLPMLAGTADTWLPIVPVDFLAQVLARIPLDERSEGGHYLVFDDRTPTLGKLLRLVASRMERRAPQSYLSVNMLRKLPAKLTGIDAESLSFISADRYDPKSLVELCRRLGLTLPSLETAVTRWVDFLLDTDFLARPAPSPRDRTVAGARVYAQGSFADAEVVFLHGVLLNSASWGRVEAEIDRPSLNLDLPGLGRSSFGGGRPHEWMTAALAELEEPPVIVAHSLGTAFAVEYAAAHPERVDSLVLVSPFFLQARPGWMLRQPWLMRQAFQFFSADQMGAQLDNAPRELWEDAHQLLQRGTVRRYNAHWLAWAARPETRLLLRDTLNRLTVPVTLVYGSADPLTEFDGRATQFTLEEVDGAGHYPQMTHADQVVSAIQR